MHSRSLLVVKAPFFIACILISPFHCRHGRLSKLVSLSGVGCRITRRILRGSPKGPRFWHLYKHMSFASGSECRGFCDLNQSSSIREIYLKLKPGPNIPYESYRFILRTYKQVGCCSYGSLRKVAIATPNRMQRPANIAEALSRHSVCRSVMASVPALVCKFGAGMFATARKPFCVSFCAITGFSSSRIA